MRELNPGRFSATTQQLIQARMTNDAAKSPRNRETTAFNRSVEQKYGLMNILDNLLEKLSKPFKPLSEFLCKQWESIAKLGRETKHQANQGIYDLRKGVSDSPCKRAWLEAQKQKENIQFRGKEQAGAIAGTIKNGLNRLFG
ncbi:hypothetical protein [Endozoicomonas lisbonensis]